MSNNKRMAVISAGFVPVPAVDGGAGEVLTTEIIEGNEKKGDFIMDVYTIESPKLDGIKYQYANIIQIHISVWNKFWCKARNFFLKVLKKRYRFIPYNRALLKIFKDDYDYILIENNMQVYEDIYNKAKNGTDHMIYHMHNDIDGTTKPECLCKFISETAETILPVSEYLKKRFNDAAPNDKMKVFYNCIDLNVFDYEKYGNDIELKEKYGIKESDFVFVYSGRICPEKGILELIKAFKGIAKQYDNIKLLVVGSRWYNLIDKDDYFNQLIDESHNVEDRIIFTGYISPNEMPAIYSLGDALVIPTMIEEAFGVVALEGMAMRLPIIATKSGGLVEVLSDETAILLDKNDKLIANLKEAMNKIMVDDIYRNKMIECAYKEVTTNKDYLKGCYYSTFKKMIS